MLPRFNNRFYIYRLLLQCSACFIQPFERLFILILPVRNSVPRIGHKPNGAHG